jgi:hypothetical protein
MLQIARLRISSLRSPGTFNQLINDWQLKRESTPLVEIVLTEQTYGKVDCISEMIVFLLRLRVTGKNGIYLQARDWLKT